MPLALDPDRMFDLWLETDAAKPAAERPTFVFRFLTGREWKRVAAIQEGIEAGMKGSEAIDRLFDALGLGLIGWRNVRDRKGAEIPFALENLDAIFGLHEAAEMVNKVLTQTSAGGDDRKKSESPSPPVTDGSAAADAPGATGPQS